MKTLKKILLAILVLILAGKLFTNYQLRDRYKGYELDLEIIHEQEGRLMAGFSAISITPEIVDTWNDLDSNARYEPKKGDTFNDLNGNGKFDPVWIAGFHNRRPANGIHDSLWARSMIIDDGQTRLALVSIDAIGFFHDQVIEVRNRLPEELGVDYCMVASTHVHEAPDLMGIWGSSPLKSGVNKDYLEMVVEGCVRSVKEAVKDLEPVTLGFSKDENSGVQVVKDTRRPIVHDPGMYTICAVNEKGSIKGTLVSWANHPETLWSKNLLITSDFPHFFRKGIEEKLGGTCVYMNGAIGGLITTHPSHAVVDPETGKELFEPTFEKAEVQGKILADIALRAISNPQDSLTHGKIDLLAKTFTIPFANKMFRAGAAIGLLDRGMTGKWKVRTEMAAWKIGPASFITIPGEIYPEIINGGIEAPEGRDFAISPVEIPPVRELMPGDFRFVFGMANDELGYIIPKSEWDNEEPWLYNTERDWYGEENSPGPETAPIIHGMATELLNQLN